MKIDAKGLILHQKRRGKPKKIEYTSEFTIQKDGKRARITIVLPKKYAGKKVRLRAEFL